jgi:hypothetical protein
LGESRAPTGTSEVELFQILANPSECKYAATIAFTLFVASVTIAPALTRDHRKFAAEINAKTLKAAAAIKTSPKASLPSQRPDAGLRQSLRIRGQPTLAITISPWLGNPAFSAKVKAAPYVRRQGLAARGR